MPFNRPLQKHIVKYFCVNKIGQNDAKWRKIRYYMQAMIMMRVRHALIVRYILKAFAKVVKIR